MAELYDAIGRGYAAHRRPDPRIAAAIVQALGPVGRLVTVGAGSGSYEPRDRPVVAVEPSREMIRQRRPGSAPAVQASATALPFRAGAFDAALAVLTVPHWPDRLPTRRCLNHSAGGRGGRKRHSPSPSSLPYCGVWDPPDSRRTLSWM